MDGRSSCTSQIDNFYQALSNKRGTVKQNCGGGNRSQLVVGGDWFGMVALVALLRLNICTRHQTRLEMSNGPVVEATGHNQSLVVTCQGWSLQLYFLDCQLLPGIRQQGPNCQMGLQRSDRSQLVTVVSWLGMVALVGVLRICMFIRHQTLRKPSNGPAAEATGHNWL